MELILWRHAEAEDGEPDEERRLTGRGKKQAKRVAKWLARRLPEDFAVISSPARRALQTARALGVEVWTNRGNDAVFQPGEGMQHLDRFVDDPMRGRPAPERQTPTPAPTPPPAPAPVPTTPAPPAAATPPAAAPAAAAPVRQPARVAAVDTPATTGDDGEVFFDDVDVGPFFEDN